MVDPITEIDVEPAGWTEHDFVPRGAARERVAGRVILRVRLHLDDSPCDKALTIGTRYKDLVE